MPQERKGGGPIRGFVVSLLAVGLWLGVIAAVAWMVHATPDSNRSIQRFRKARRSLAPQGRRHRAPAPSTSETSTVVVMASQRRSRANRVIDLRERDPEPRPARWPADGWSLGSVTPSGPRVTWATSGASPSMRTEAPASPAKSSGRWRVIDLTPSEPKPRSIPAPPPAHMPSGRREAEVQRWGLAAGAEAQGAPGPLPAVFRLDPLHARNEAGSRAR